MIAVLLASCAFAGWWGSTPTPTPTFECGRWVNVLSARSDGGGNVYPYYVPEYVRCTPTMDKTPWFVERDGRWFSQGREIPNPKTQTFEKSRPAATATPTPACLPNGTCFPWQLQATVWAEVDRKVRERTMGLRYEVTVTYTRTPTPPPAPRPTGTCARYGHDWQGFDFHHARAPHCALLRLTEGEWARRGRPNPDGMGEFVRAVRCRRCGLWKEVP